METHAASDLIISGKLISYQYSHFTEEKMKALKLRKLEGEQDGRGVGGCGVHLSPWIHQEYSFRHRSACRTPAESRQEYLTGGKEYIELWKTQWDEGTRGKTGSVSMTGPALRRWGIEAEVRPPHQGNCLSQRRNI